MLVKLGPTLKNEGWGTRRMPARSRRYEKRRREGEARKRESAKARKRESAKSLRSPAALNSKALTRRRRDT